MPSQKNTTSRRADEDKIPFVDVFAGPRSDGQIKMTSRGKGQIVSRPGFAKLTSDLSEKQPVLVIPFPEVDGKWIPLFNLAI